ncbi:helix-turn-helix domain-containing protein [Pseudosporangium ferrugineum]|uniref:Helix-turn-helix protein n=1 Tax=Pseudosporangium ferrugineum TaxID=439699 RepID=A0A2T0SCH0_9ACTN|nr:helix-turn-helix domain-containing protein [Pseudosporangium ferrugineum]PRY31118.1 helix-turn-helix protein [Pseudosporangium ferrugineum]
MEDDTTSSIERRVTELERRFAELIGRSADEKPAPTPSRPPDTFWALNGLRDVVGEDNAGAVLFTGMVNLPTGEHLEWQHDTAVDDMLEADWSDWAGTLGALGHPIRLLLLRRVLAGARSATELAADEALGTTGQLYHHLRQLVSAGWLRSSVRGQYTVPDERVVPLLVILSGAKQ